MASGSLIVCLAWLASIVAAAVLVTHTQGHYYPHPGYVCLLAIMGAHVGLAGLAVGLLQGRRWWPIVALLATIAGWSWLWGEYLSASSREEVASLCLAQSMLVILASGIGRLVWHSATGAERERPEHRAAVATRGVRVWHLFVVITVIAVAAAVLSHLAAGRTSPHDDLLWLTVSGSTACLGSAWIVLAARRRLAGTILLCLVLAALSFYGGPKLGDPTGGVAPLLAINGLQTLLVMAALVLWQSLIHPSDRDALIRV